MARKRYRTYTFEVETDLGDGRVCAVVVRVDRFGVVVKRKRSRTKYALGLSRVARFVAVEDQKLRIAAHRPLGIVAAMGGQR